LYSEFARLYGENESSIVKVMNNKERIRATFSVAPQTAEVTARALDKVLMKVEKALNFWMEKHDFIVLSSLETVRDTVQYRYCVLS